MNTKVIVALVVGLALVGLTGAASAAYYHIDGNYEYSDGAANVFWADTGFEVEFEGTTSLAAGDKQMHNWVDNYMSVDSDFSDASGVAFAFKQAGASTLTIETDIPTTEDNRNTFVSQDVASQEIDYDVDGDAFDIYFYGDSDTHASTHGGILPVQEMAVWDYNDVVAGANIGVVVDGEIIDWKEDDVRLAAIKSGNIGYECTTHGRALMEVENVLEPVRAGSGITVWSNADGEIWEPYGVISTDAEGNQDVWMWWLAP